MATETFDEIARAVAYLRARARHFTFLSNVRLRSDTTFGLTQHLAKAEAFRDAAHELETGRHRDA